MSSPLTPREFAERALVGSLLSMPSRVTAIAQWLQPEDFRSHANATVFTAIRDLVAARSTTETVWALYLDEAAITLHHVQRDAISPQRLEQEQDATGQYLQLAQVDIPRGIADADLHTAVLAELNRFDFWQEVVGDDIVFGGVVYSRTEWDEDPEDGVRRLTADERTAALDNLAAEQEREEERRWAVPGVNPISVYDAIASSGELGTSAVTAPFLHTLLATAPPNRQAQPEAYALMVLEASIRRDVQQSGLRTGQAAETVPDLAQLLSTVEASLERVEYVQHRWNTVIGHNDQARRLATPPPAAPPVQPDIPDLLDGLGAPPDDRDIRTAEESVLGHAFLNPAALDRLVDRLLPDDFANRDLAATYQAALDVHLNSSSPSVDPVTVAWEQQRQERQNGPGLPVEAIAELAAQAPPIATPEWAAEVVLRGALSRLTASAATAVQEAAQHPGLQPNDLLHTTRMTYAAVLATAQRMAGSATVTTRLDGHGTTDTDLVPAARTPRSTAAVIDLRQRSAALRGHLAQPTPMTPAISSRLTPETQPSTDTEHELGPELDT